MRIKTLILAAGAAALLAACGPTPDTVVRDFHTHLNEGKPDEALKLIDPASTRTWGPKLDAKMTGMAERMARCGGIDKLDVVKLSGVGDLAEFKVSASFKKPDDKQCAGTSATFKTRKIDGTWYIVLR